MRRIPGNRPGGGQRADAGEVSRAATGTGVRDARHGRRSGVGPSDLRERPWQELVLPAVRLAREGFVVNAPLASSLNGVLQKSPGNLPNCIGSTRRLRERSGGGRPAGPAGSGPDAGADRHGRVRRRSNRDDRRPDRGRDAGGRRADHEAGPGRLPAHVREPIHGTYRGYDVYGPPPPSSGGICLVEMLNILENFPLRAPADRRRTARPPRGRPGPCT